MRDLEYNFASVRAAYLIVYAAFAALGEALVAKPALLWLRGQGLLHAALPWDVPLGAWSVLLALLLAASTLALSLRFALGERARVPHHAAFLLLVALCLALRGAAGEAVPPLDPTPRLLEGLRTAAAQLDGSYAGRYIPDALALDTALLRLGPSGFRRRFHFLPMRARLVRDAGGPQRTPVAGDEPGTLYVALSADGKRAWLSIVSLEGAEPAVLSQTVAAVAGTHSLPGQDARVPAYPGMRETKDPALRADPR